jgi:hypothetical protein
MYATLNQNKGARFKPSIYNIETNMKIQIALATIGCTLMTMLMPNPSSAQIPSIGTNRRPQTCPSRKAPAKGAPSLAQAKRYFTCHAELEVIRPNKGSGPSALNLIDNLNMQISARARRFSPSTDSESGLNHRLNKPLGLTSDLLVYDIQGSYTIYECNDASYNKPGANCSISQFNDSRGVCFQNTFGDWHCTMVGAPEAQQRKGPPPQ